MTVNLITQMNWTNALKKKEKDLPKLTRDRNLSSLLPKKLNLLSKTFPQKSVQAQMVLLVKAIKHSRKKKCQIFTNSFRKYKKMEQILHKTSISLITKIWQRSNKKSKLYTNFHHEQRHKIPKQVEQNILYTV